MLRRLREFQNRFRFEHPQSEDFFQVIEEITGQDFSWFYQTFFQSAKTFDHGIASLQSWLKPPKLIRLFDEGGIKKEINWQEVKSSLNETKTYFNEIVVRRYEEAKVSPYFPLIIKFVYEDNSEEIKTWDGQERWIHFITEKPTRVRYVRFDPDNIWVIDANWANNSRSLESHNQGVFRQAVSFLFILQNFFLLLSGLV
ncbi:MAG: hypothetical protein N3B16_08270 [Candidatus Aminicenantes bacterium]|nr:hypothetical protein [Candidatus Aminicenantes bacterium]